MTENELRRKCEESIAKYLKSRGWDIHGDFAIFEVEDGDCVDVEIEIDLTSLSASMFRDGVLK